MKNLMTRLFREEEGQGMVEYAILVALISIVAIIAVKTVGKKVDGAFEKVAEQLEGFPDGKDK